jgi:hypothetical protein
MIGLPFANRGSVELIEKMKYAKDNAVSECKQVRNSY